MDLQLSVFLLFILSSGGHSLRCYQCMSQMDSCADQQETTCPELFTCFSSVTAAPFEGNTTKVKIKGCLPSHACLSSSISSADVSLFCCTTDLCNAKDAELSGESSPGIYDISNDLNPPNPNGNNCYYCDGKSCSNTLSCSGDEDHCIKATGPYNGQSIGLKTCATKEVCVAVSSVSVEGISCCEGNLCNGAQSVTQSFLFLCCSLLSYFLLH